MKELARLIGYCVLMLAGAVGVLLAVLMLANTLEVLR